MKKQTKPIDNVPAARRLHPHAWECTGSPAPSYRTAVFQLDSSMIRFDAPSTSLFLGWQSDAHALLHLGLDGVTAVIHITPAADTLLRAGTLALFSGAGLIVSQAFSLTAHDQSHMEAASAIGATDVGLVRSSNGQPMSIWEFFWEAFNFTEEPGLYTYLKSNPTLTELAYVSGEGLDTNMLIAEKVSRKITEGEGHVTDLAPYLLNKLWGINYFSVTGPTSDAENYMDLVNAQGHGTVDRTRFIGLHAAACLLSGGFLSLARGAWSYIFTGESAVTPLRARIGEVSLFWPELTTWLNPDNVSLLVMAEGAWRDAAFVRVGVDTPVMGNTAQNPELTLGTRVKIEKLSVGLEITSRIRRDAFLPGRHGARPE